MAADFVVAATDKKGYVAAADSAMTTTALLVQVTVTFILTARVAAAAN